MADTDTLLPEEQHAWSTITGLLTTLPAVLDAALGRAANLTYFEYTALAALAAAEGRTLSMSTLAHRTHGSLSRVSHVIRRLEAQGLVRRETSLTDRRVTEAVLTPTGLDRVRVAAPVHDRHVRQLLEGLDVSDLTVLDRLGGHVLQRLAPARPEGRDARRTEEATPLAS